MLKFAAITPHPPVIVPTVGTDLDLKKAKKTIKSMEKLAEVFAKKKIETIILISPHGPVEYQEITINASPALSGNFEQFNDYETSFNFENDLKFVDLLVQRCKNQKIPVKLVDSPILDHGTLVPLYYLTQYLKNNKTLKVVSMGYSYPDSKINFDFGKIIFDAVNIKKKTKHKRYALIASGDLSHCLSFEAPNGFDPQGPEFDRQIVKLLDRNNIRGVLKIDANLIKEAAECGYLSIVTLLGALDQFNRKRLFGEARFKYLSYEGPFGVGYLVGYYLI
jgi:aromatic ring-opening dioxygenase LigB subunit